MHKTIDFTHTVIEVNSMKKLPNTYRWLVFGLGCFLFFMSLMMLQMDFVKANKNDNEPLLIQMVTVEFKTKTDDGKEIEAYRWDPGTIFVPKGEDVTLSIFGVNGKSHPFYIEGTDIKGDVKKGEETIVKLRFDEEGIYRIVCTAHETIKQNGPMIGYIVVR